MTAKASAAKILADFLSPIEGPFVFDKGDLVVDWELLAPSSSGSVKGAVLRPANKVIRKGHPVALTGARRADDAEPIVAAVEKDDPPVKVLGFLAANGPTRSVDVIDNIVGKDNSKPLLTLTAVASAIDRLVAEGTLERRQGERIAVVGDPR